MQRPAKVSLMRLAPVLGLGIGGTLVLTSPHQSAPLWLVWASLVLALGATAGVVFVYGLNRWAELVALHPVRVRDVAAPIFVIELVGLLAVNATQFLPGVHGNGRNALLTTLAILAGTPAACAMYGVGHVAASETLSSTAGGLIARLVTLRQLLQRLLAAVGALVTVVTLEFGALLALERSVHSQFGNRPPQFVLVYGGIGSLLVALAYAPGWTALQHRCNRLCDELFPMDCLDEASTILARSGDRQKLEQILGADRGLLADMQSGVVILAPLIAGAAAFLLPH
jgi:hypothetical protein